MSESKTLFDRFNLRIKNNPIAAFLILLGTIVIALSAFSDAAKNLWHLVMKETRPDINGKWQAEVIYDWQDAEYSETFIFHGHDTELYGTASFLGMKRAIFEGMVENNTIQFITKTQEVLGDWTNPKPVIHRYQGRILRDEINFVMQTEGGFSEHTPIEFTARRDPDYALPAKH